MEITDSNLIQTSGYKMKRCRNYYDQEEEEEERLIPSSNGFSLKKTPTYYQWNRTPPSCHNPPNPEKKSWEQRRTVLLKKYSAVE
ncbi:hypothetical protein INT48_000257 [Thamnidium elegans]|uniref:Uncharacterized protein n=1 Tax=Thamnidium elegans TaxID=101142 RepID=A0A8H7SRP4_9FUNG|nr:hypothetical protein INT48_000257 [Thamnidium elegans]